MADIAQMEQGLQAQKQMPAPAPQAGGMPQAGAPAPQQPQQASGQGQTSPEMQMMIQHLDSLPEQDKAFVAQYLSPETAKWAGLILGSEEVTNYFSQLADPNITLIPVPKDIAEQQAAQGQTSSEGSMPQAQPQQMAVQKPPMGTEQM